MPLFNTGNFLTTSFASINRGVAWVASLLDWNSRKQITVNGAEKTPTESFSYTTAESWNETNSAIVVDGASSGKCIMNSGDASNDVRAWKALGTTLSDTKWVIDFDYLQTDETPRAGAFPICLTAGSSEPDNATQDMIGVKAFTSTQTLRLIYKDGAGSVTANDTNPITIVNGTQYYCRLIRHSATKTELIVYLDSDRSEVVGSQISSNVPSTVTGLTHIQHSIQSGSAGDLFNFEIDNTNIYNNTTTVENIPSQQTADALFGDSHNQVIEDFTTYASQGDADADWVPVETKFLVNITNDELDWNAVRDGTNDSIAYDLGASVVSDSNWVLRFKARVDGITGGGTGYGKGIAIGLSSANQTSSDSNSQDSMSFTIETQDTDTNLFKLGAGDGAGMLSQNVETGSISDAVFQNTWYIELIRDGSQLRGNVYRNSDFSNLYESLTLNTTGTISGLRYLVARNRNGTASAQSGGNNGAIDDIEFFNNITEVNPSTITDYVLPIKIQGDADLKRKTTENLEELFASDSWVDNDSSKVGVNTTNQRLEFIGTLVNGDNNTSVFDLGAGNVSDSKFTCDIDLEFTTLTASANNIFWIGFSDSDQTAGENTGQDFLGFRIVYTSGTKKFGTIDSDGASPDVLADNQQTMADITTGRKYYIRLQRLSTTKYQLLIFADKARTIQLDKIDGTCASTTDSLRYIKVMPYESVTEAGEISGFIDKIRFWNGITNPVAQETPTFEDDFTSYANTTEGDNAWVPNDSAQNRVSPTNDRLDFDIIGNATDDSISYDLQQVLGAGVNVDDEKWCIRFKLHYTTIIAGVGYGNHHIGLSDKNVAHNVAQDHIGTGCRMNTGTDYGAFDSDNAVIPNITAHDDSVAITWATGKDYFYELARTSATTYRVRLYNDANYSDLHGEANGTCTRTTQNLRYFKIWNDMGSGTGETIGYFDDFQFWNGISSPNASGRKFVFTNDDITDTAIQYPSKTLSYDPINGDYYGEVKIPTLTTGTDFNLYMYHNYSPSANPSYVPDNLSSSYDFTDSVTSPTDSMNNLNDTSSTKQDAILITASSKYIGRLLKSISFYLKIGSGTPTGTIPVRIETNGGTTKETSSTSLNATSLTGSFAKYTFVFTGQTKIEAGDRIVLDGRNIPNASGWITDQGTGAVSQNPDTELSNYNTSWSDNSAWDHIHEIVTTIEREKHVYDLNYKAVYHLQGNSLDSTVYGNDGTNTSVDWTEQNNDVGLLANGTTTGIDVGSDSSLANIFSGGGHISAIINPKSDGEGNNGMILHKRTSDGWQFLVTGESGGFVKIQFLRGFSTTDGFWTTTNLVIPLNEVSFVDVFYNEDSVNNDPIIKVNGITQAITEGATPVGTASSETSETLHIADSSGSTNSFDGFISNLKVSDKIRPSSQAIATYNAEKSGSDIITTASSVSQ